MSDLGRFTGLTVTVGDFEPPTRRHPGPWPATWTRHQFNRSPMLRTSLRDLNAWIEANLHGRYGSYSMPSPSGTIVVVLFEQANDAVAFRMWDGETSAFAKP
jgi:hypothetical protein